MISENFLDPIKGSVFKNGTLMGNLGNVFE